MAKHKISKATRKGRKSVDERRGQALAATKKTIMKRDFNFWLKELILSPSLGYGNIDLLPLSFPYYDLM